jgi:hypothetical protein
MEGMEMNAEYRKRSNSKQKQSLGQVAICLNDQVNAAGVKEALKTRHLQPFCTRLGGEMRGLLMEMIDPVILLSDPLPGKETVWLTARKILVNRPQAKILVLGTRPSVKAERMAEFIGVRYLPYTDEARVAEEVAGLLAA